MQQIEYVKARRIYGRTKDKIQTQSKVPPIDFHAKTGLAVEYSMSGNMTQASTQEYSLSDIPPIDFRSDGNGISAYSIYGNMVQKSPNISPSISTWNNGYLNFAGEVVAPDTTKREMYSNQIAVKPSTNYVFSCENGFPSSEPNTAWKTASLYKADGTYITRLTATTDSDPFVITTTSETGFIVIMLRTFGENVNIMLNEGATALPYIPYDATPTPDAPIMPEECGDRTANLFPLDATKLHVGRIENDGTIDYEVDTITVGTNSVTYQANATWRGFYTDYIQADENATLTFSPNDSSSMSWSCICYDENNNFLGRATAQSTASIKTFTTLASTKKVRIAVTSSLTEYTITNPMLNTGSTALPYEPYNKYKIPITVGGQTQNVYLDSPIRKIGNYSDIVNDDGTVTRNIKQIDLGDLTWGITASGNFTSQELLDGIMVMNTQVAPAMCSHFQIVKADSYGSTPYSACGSINNVCKVSIDKTGYEGMTVTQFKDAMSGIKYWYALLTPEVEQITSPTITTQNGNNTLSIGTTLQPSSVSLTTSSSVYPLNPIIPEEVGDRTANLFDGQMEQGTLTSSGVESDAQNRIRCADFITLSAGNYTISASSTLAGEIRVFGFVYDLNGQFEERIPSDWTAQPFSFTLSAKKKFRFVLCILSGAQPLDFTPSDVNSIMLNSGSTALPYEPFGYKITLNL